MEIRIDSDNEGKTIRSLLRDGLGFSSSMLKKVKFSPGGITVNGDFRTVRYELKKGDLLSVRIEDTADDVSPYIKPVDLALEIIYKDEYYTVINKPPHMPAHPSFGHRDDTVANALAFLNPDIPFVFRPVNRLDADTSGVMIVANSKLSSYYMNSAMCEGRIHKTYISVLDGILEEKSGKIETHLRRVDDSVIKREVCGEESGKRSVTYYRVLCENNGKTLVEVNPVTGRTHQIRVHFSYLGAPVTGDTLYGTSSAKIDRQALHAYRVSFDSPGENNRVEYIAELASDIKNLIVKSFGESALKLIL